MNNLRKLKSELIEDLERIYSWMFQSICKPNAFELAFEATLMFPALGFEVTFEK